MLYLFCTFFQFVQYAFNFKKRVSIALIHMRWYSIMGINLFPCGYSKPDWKSLKTLPLRNDCVQIYTLYAPATIFLLGAARLCYGYLVRVLVPLRTIKHDWKVQLSKRRYSESVSLNLCNALSLFYIKVIFKNPKRLSVYYDEQNKRVSHCGRNV